MSDKKKIIQQYLKEVTSGLNCPRSLKSVFIGELKNEIAAFSDSREDITLSELYEKFGTVDAIAAGFYDRHDYEDLLKKAKKRAVIWKIISAVLLVVLIVVVIYFTDYIIHTGGTIHVTDPLD